MPLVKPGHLRVAAGLIVMAAGLFVFASCAKQAMSKRSQLAATMPILPAVSAATSTEFPPISDAQGHALGYSFPVAPPTEVATKRSPEEITSANATCVACHTATDAHSMHGEFFSGRNKAAFITCVDCHGGHNNLPVPAGIAKTDPRFAIFKAGAHVKPRVPELWKTSANPEIPAAATNKESADFIRFVNPGDLRAAYAACYNCHGQEVARVEKSMMAHGSMLWGAALYNNGAINRKAAVFGESYAIDGTPRAIKANPQPTTHEAKDRGWLTALWPLPRWEISQPGNLLRVFERGAKFRPQVGQPERDEDAGKPDVKLSLRGLGTENRTDPVFLGLQKTRLLDPTLNQFGTNDHPGDFRASGCSACHVVYANDNSPVHSAMWSQFGHAGKTATVDPNIPKDEPGHPIKHVFVKNVPTSSCIVCHIHPGTNVVNAYLGFTWWDNETGARLMYPSHQKYPTNEQRFSVSQHNPEGSAARGLWSDLYPNDTNHAGQLAGPDFLANVAERINPQLKQTQLADFHGHGWVFRAVFKQDRHGNLLDRDGKIITDLSPEKMAAGVAFTDPKTGAATPPNTPVHLKDVHLQMGMQCVDCHFQQDMHGDGHLYGETRNAIAEECIDCHGDNNGSPPMIAQYLAERDAKKKPALLAKAFTGKAAASMKPADMKRVIDDRFEIERDGGAVKLFQKSALDDKVRWEIRLASDDRVKRDTWNDTERDAATARAALYAHTIQKDGKTWGTFPTDAAKLAHQSGSMSCYSCHTSWNTSCFGCHLPMKANAAKPMLHNEGALTKNYTNYNFQTLRDDVYMLGKDSSAKGGKIVPIRSACAVMVGSEDANRQVLYGQQQTISAEGFAGTAFSPYFPHTVRSTETKKCTDCHVAEKGDNNAIMAQLLLQGTNSANFVGRFAWLGLGDEGLEAVAVTERDEPQAVIGSRLHEFAYPDFFKQHQSRGKELAESHTHHGHVLDLQLRGEYLYTACGEEGFIAYDVANVDNKGFSERILTAPVSPLGQRLSVKTKFATSVCSPSTLAIDPTRPRRPENQEGAIHPMYAFLYVTDREEGLVVIGNKLSEKKNKPGVATLLDGDPENNFLSRALAFNPGGALSGARSMTFVGHYAYIATDAGLRVVDMDNPLAPRLLDTPGVASLTGVKKIAAQFRYAFVLDRAGMKVIDLTDPSNPRLIPNAETEVSDARDIYLSRTYAYIAAGRAGLVIVDVETPAAPKLIRSFTAGGEIVDATAVKIGMTNSCQYAYVADGIGGLKVIQLTSAEAADGTPGYLGFAPKPEPRLIARYKTKGPAIALSEGLDRDRAVDESGNQLAVFGRLGARPMNLEEQQRLYLRTDSAGRKTVYVVRDEPSEGPATKPSDAAETTPPKTAAPPEPARRRRR